MCFERRVWLLLQSAVNSACRMFSVSPMKKPRNCVFSWDSYWHAKIFWRSHVPVDRVIRGVVHVLRIARCGRSTVSIRCFMRD